MLRYILSHSIEGILTLENSDCPANVNEFRLGLSRSKIYGSVLREYTISDKFHGIGKEYIDNIVEKYGPNAEINIDVELFDDSTYTWNKIITNGRISFAKLKQVENYTDVNIEDGSFQAKVMNRHETEIDYFNLITIDGAEIIDFLEPVQDISLRGIEGNTLVKSIRPKNLFNRIVNSIAGIADNVDCSLFEYFPHESSLSLVMFANGRQIRTFETATFSISLKDAFEALSANACLGMGFEEIDGKVMLIIAPRRYFFQPKVICTLENISDLEYSWDEDLLNKDIAVGYANFEKNENQYGQSEYNNKAKYSTPLTQFKGTLNIVSNVRADATTIESLRILGKSNQTSKFDNENFLIDCVKDENNNIVSRQLEGLATNPSGIYAQLELYTNCLLSPARMLKNWGEFASIGLQFDRDKYLKIQKSETLTRLITQKTGEEEVKDGEDILISDLGYPFLTGREVRFNATFSESIQILIRNTSNGLIKFKDIINKKYNFAYIKDFQLVPESREHQFIGYEAYINEETLNDNVLIEENTGLEILAENGAFIKLEPEMIANTSITQMENLASIPDDAFYVVAYNGKNYNQSGAQLKAALKVDINGVNNAILQPNEEGIIILGSNDTKTYIISYEFKRGDRFRSGGLTIVCNEDNNSAVVSESGTAIKPLGFEETGGILLIDADVLSTQVRLKITTDSQDLELGYLKYLVTKL